MKKFDRILRIDSYNHPLPIDFCQYGISITAARNKIFWIAIMIDFNQFNMCPSWKKVWRLWIAQLECSHSPVYGALSSIPPAWRDYFEADRFYIFTTMGSWLDGTYGELESILCRLLILIIFKISHSYRLNNCRHLIRIIFVTNLKVQQFYAQQQWSVKLICLFFQWNVFRCANLKKFDLILRIDSDYPCAANWFLSIWNIYHCGEKKDDLNRFNEWIYSI